MRTLSAAGHVTELVTTLCNQRGVTPLSGDQLDVVRAAVERLYGVPLDLPTPGDVAEMKAQLEERSKRP